MKTTVYDGFISREEKETVLRFDYLEQKWYMDSTVPNHFKKALKQGWEAKEQIVNKDGLVLGMYLEAPSHCVSFNNVQKRHREMTEEQKHKLSERMKAMWKENKS